MKRILIVGGANGIGLSIAKVLSARKETEKVYILDKVSLAEEYKEDKILELKDCGASLRQLERLTGIGKGVIHRIWCAGR